MFEIHKSGDKTNSGEIGLDIRAHASPKVGQDQVSGGVSVPCRHATPVKSLNSLEEYCAKWRLRINESKTMVMQVSKCGRLPPKTFKINDVELTNTKTYKYLGIVFDSAGNFNQARINMNERGQKAMYKLKSAVDRTILNSAVAIIYLIKQ